MAIEYELDYFENTLFGDSDWDHRDISRFQRTKIFKGGNSPPW